MGGWKLSKHTASPFLSDCEPELDTTKPLDPNMDSFYQSQNWAVELGQINMVTEVSLLASHTGGSLGSSVSPS